MSKKSFTNILPDHKTLLERVTIWDNIFAKYENDDDEEDVISFDAIPYSESDDQSDNSNNSMEEFEDKSIPDNEQDPEFDIQKTLDSTLQIVQKLENNHRENELDKVMNSFHNQINGKVLNWIKGNQKYYNKYNPSSNENLSNKEFAVHVDDSILEDESLESVNTAKYILSNRKVDRSTHLTKTTIKEFCYSNRQNISQNSKNDENLYDLTKNHRNTKINIKTPETVSKACCHTSDKSHQDKDKKFPQRFKKKLKQKRRYYNNFNTSSSTESSKETSNQSRKLKIKLKQKKKKKYYKTSFTLESSSEVSDRSILKTKRVRFISQYPISRKNNIISRKNSYEYLQDKCRLNETGQKYKGAAIESNTSINLLGNSFHSKYDKNYSSRRKCKNFKVRIRRLHFTKKNFRTFNQQINKLTTIKGATVNNRENSNRTKTDKIKNNISDNVNESNKKSNESIKNNILEKVVYNKRSSYHLKDKDFTLNNKNKLITKNEKPKQNNSDNLKSKSIENHSECYAKLNQTVISISSECSEIENHSTQSNCELVSNKSDKSSVDSIRNRLSINNKSSISNKLFNRKESHIVLHDPNWQDDTINSFQNDQIIINEKILKNKIGSHLTKKFLNGRNTYMNNFNIQSIIIFVLPDENDKGNSSNSEEDFLENKFLKNYNKNGKIIEICKYSQK